VRSSARIPKEIPILLIGSDLDGRMFSERTSTVLLSLHGAGILSRHKLSPEQELILRWPEKNKETDIRVVGHIGAQGHLHTYGVAFFDLTLNFWEIDFPPISEQEKQLGVITLFCTSCNTRENIDDTSVEADVCATNESVLRTCKRCASTTLWKPVSGSVLPVPPPQTALGTSPQLPLFSAPTGAPPPPAQAPPPPSNFTPLPTHIAPSVPEPSFYAQSPGFSPAAPLAPSNFSASRSAYVGDSPDLLIGPAASSPEFVANPAGARPDPVGRPPAAVLTLPSPPDEKSADPQPTPAAARINRRKHPRIKVSYSACIRHPERGEEVVTCEDMSKGGLCFKSRQKYYAQTLIEVAVPYSKGQQAIFVPARIVFVEPLPEQSLYRYGVQYLTPTRPRDSF
jgi:hypothetical protein